MDKIKERRKDISRKYTEEEIHFLETHYQTMSVKELASRLNRTEKAVRLKIEKMRLSLRDLPRNASLWTEDKVTYLKDHYKTVVDHKMAKHLGMSEGTVCRKRKELGLRKHTQTPYVSGGYLMRYENRKKLWSHKLEMEKHLNRKLERHEVVHHVDGDKLNNDISNLYLCRDKSHHGKVHHSLEEVAFELMKQGIILFQDGRYHIAKGKETT